MSTIQVYNITTKETGYANSENIPTGWSADESVRLIVEDFIVRKNDYEEKIKLKLRDYVKKELLKDGIEEPV